MGAWESNQISKMCLDDGIIQIVFDADVTISIDFAKAIIQRRLELSNFKDYPLYVDIRGVLSVDEKARKYLSSSEGTKNALGAAIHVNSPISKFLGNLFIKVDKPDKPAKLFTDKAEAIAWLKKIK